MFADQPTSSIANLTSRITSFVRTLQLRAPFYRASSFSVHITDDPEVFKGAPISLQVVGGTHEEEAVIAMTEVVDKALKAYKATL